MDGEKADGRGADAYAGGLDRHGQTAEDSIAMAKRLGVKFVACNTSLGFMGLEEDAFIPEVDSFAGAATFLGEARKGAVNLFI